ncbi:MAG: hypothetical protein V1728_03670 [Candidatus Micrarchaeota archaeon]
MKGKRKKTRSGAKKRIRPSNPARAFSPSSGLEARSYEPARKASSRSSSFQSPDGEPCHVFKILANKPLQMRYAVLPRPRGLGPAVRRFLENVKVGR